MKITILMANQCSSTSVSATLEFIECANVLYQHANKTAEKLPALFEVETASMDGLAVTCTGGLVLTPQKSLAQVQNTQLIIVPGFMFNILSVLPSLSPMVSWLQDMHEQGAYIAAMCTGAFVLGQTGLLNGKQATTHWIFSEQFRRAFPRVKLQTERTVTDDGMLMCSGGSTTGTDLLLHIIRKFSSPQLATECAKKLLVDATPRSQTPYSQNHFKKLHGDADILKIQIIMEKRLSQSLSMEAIAAEFNLSMRNFIRRFKEATEQTPIQYLQNLRVERAKYLLESSQEGVDQITLQVGYEDANSFRRLFKDRVGLTPSAYRKRFCNHG